jgi:hypothetical protein
MKWTKAGFEYTIHLDWSIIFDGVAALLFTYGLINSDEAPCVLFELAASGGIAFL